MGADQEWEVEMKKSWMLLSALLALALSFGTVSIVLAQGETPPQNTEHREGIRGEVTDISGHTFTVQTRRGEVHVVTSSDTVFRVPGVENATIGDIAVGDPVAAVGRRTGQTFHARMVAVIPPDANPARVGGQVAGIDGNDITVNTRGGEAVVVRTDADTIFRLPGVEGPSLDDVHEGDLIVAAGTWNDDGSLQAAVVAVPREMNRRGRVTGEVAAIEGSTLTLRLRGEREVAIQTDAETAFHVPGVENATLADVAVGDRSAVAFQTREGTIYATTIVVFPEQAARLAGRVSGIEGMTILLETRHGAVEVLTGADTLFRVPGVENASIDDIEVGDAAGCGGQWESEETFRALAVIVQDGSPGEGRPGAVAGRATSVGSEQLTIGSARGPVTVLVGEETAIRVPGVENPTLSDIHVGDPVGARGRWNGEGALEAAGVAVLTRSGDKQPSLAATANARQKSR